MKIQILKNNGDLALDLNLVSKDISEEDEQKITSLDKEIVESYTFIFGDNVSLEMTHDIESLEPDQLKSITIKLK